MLCLQLPGIMKSKLQQTSQGNNTKTDAVSTTTTILPVYGVTLAGVGDLMTAATKHLMPLSQTSVSLAGGASAEVTITISGDDLATAGDYEVKVTATSQGDNMKTAEVTTQTTILPVYGVTLASEGVSYMLTVTNTGNTDDVINLTSSNNAATLSQTRNI
jgi:hypothetical protein